MKRCILFILIVACMAVFPAWAGETDTGLTSQETGGAQAEPVRMPPTPASKPGADYIIGPGDVLDISLWRDDALTKQVVVLPDGKISYPLIGEIIAGGRTIGDLKSEIADKLVPYVPEPVLNIEVKQVNSMLLYIIGRVNSPGRFVLNTNVDVLQALSIAGGLNPFAKRSKIKILRKQGGQTKTFPFDYDEVVDGENLAQNITLQRGDVIVVP